MEKFHYKIKKIRLNYRLSIKQMAEKIKTSPTTIKRWEQGLSNPRVATLIKIARLLEMKINDLLF